MKKYLRLLALVLSFLLICLAFCGCIDLDDERKHHALWKDDEKTVILLNNKEYKLLPKCETLNPIEKFDYDYYVTENDVPLLSKSTYGDMVSLSADENFIIYNGYEDAEEKHIYCIVDKYEEILSRINSTNILDFFCYEYDEYDAETEEYKTTLYRFTKEEAEAVSTVLRFGQMTIDNVYKYDSHTMRVYRCSEDMLFRNYAFDLVVGKSKAHLVVEYTVDEEYETYTTTLEVPDEDYSIFRQIAEEYINSER